MVILDGLTFNKENTTKSGVCRATGALSSLTLMVGGADESLANLSETIIFMPPTVIDRSAENQPNSAFRAALRRKVQEASEVNTTVDGHSRS